MPSASSAPTLPFLERLLDGEKVEWKTLGEVCVHLRTGLNPRRNFKLNTEDASNYYVTVRELGGTELLYSEKTDLINDDALQLINNRSKLKVNDILFSGTGTIGKTAFISKEPTNWNIKEGVYALTLNTHYVLPMFVLRYLQTQSTIDWIDRMAAGGTVRSITMKNLEQLPIPIPPLRVQARIVEILDKFTQLEAELEAELEARNKQYDFYRNRLLDFALRDDLAGQVEWKTLGEICEKVCSGGTPLTSHSKYYEGNIPWLRTQDIDWQEIHDTEIKITEEAIANSSAKLIPENCVIVAMYGATAAKACINKIPLTTNQACCNLQIDEKQAHYKYAYYWICNEYERLRAQGEGSQSNLNAKKIKSYPIPLPPLSEQRRIVEILDRFDTLTNSISEGLPREITLRRKQYEYYRDALLRFPQPAPTA